MDAREKELIKTVSRTLQNIASAPFSNGGLEEWSKWANSMQLTIRSSVAILDSLTRELPEEKQKNSEDDFILKNLK
jgi:hypothetical protein